MALVPLMIPSHIYAYKPQLEQKIEYSEPQDTTITPGFHGDYVVADPEAVRKATEEWEKEEAIKKQKALVNKKPAGRLPYDPCSCVSYAKWLSGINVGSMSSFGVGQGAKNHPVNSSIPAVGSIVVFKAGVGVSSNGHLAVVIEANGNLFKTKGANETSCVAGTIRSYDMGVDYWRIKGFWNKDIAGGA